MSEVLDQVAQTAKRLMVLEPFYGLFLITLNKVINEEVKTAGVSKNGINVQLAVAPSFWTPLTVDQRIGLLKHELLHIVFFHLSYRDKFSDKHVFNIAADMEINQYIDRKYHPTPNLYLPTTYPELKLEPFKGTKYYYDELAKALQQNTCPNLSQTIAEMRDGEGVMHESWNEFDGMSDSEKDLMSRQVDYQIKEIVENNKNCGSVPGELKAYIDSLFAVKPAIFDWKAYIRRFMGTSNKVYTHKTRKKDSKRFVGFPALKIKVKKHILVAIDTSGSVSDEELQEFFSEVYHIWKAGVKVTVAQCDADIHDIREYTGTFDGRITGRGGTSFQPPIDYFNENIRRYTTLVYLTDGYAGMPTGPKKGKMLWVMSKSSQALESFVEWPGYKIKIP